MFYARRGGELPRAKTIRPKLQTKNTEPLLPVLEAVKSLGLTAATIADVAWGVKELFPSGWTAMPEAEVIRGVFIYLKRQNSNDNVAR